MELDLLLRGGTLVDGTGAPRRRADVGIRGSTVVAIGPDVPADGARRVIDCRGRIVAPGFVEIHSHADFVLTHPDHGRILRGFHHQGVTTLVVGNCGYGAAPCVSQHEEELRRVTGFMRPDGAGWGWRDHADYLEALERDGVAFNVGVLAAHGPIRLAVAGLAKRTTTVEERRAMRRELERALDAGALGMSAGLMYLPGAFADTDELVELATPLARRGRVFVAHTRNLSHLVVRAVDELIEIGRRAQVAVHHSHLVTSGRHNFHLMDECLEHLHAACRSGVDAAFDVLMHTGGNSTIDILFPPWITAGGWDEVARRLEDELERARLRRVMEGSQPVWPPWEHGGWCENLPLDLGWDALRLLTSPTGRNADVVGLTFAEIGERWGTDGFEAACRIAREEAGGASVAMLGQSGFDDDERPLRAALTDGLSSVISDANVQPDVHGSPSAWGTAPRLLGRYVRELGLLDLETAIHKLSGKPARRLGIERGELAEGAVADLVVFDPATVIDHATFTDPTAPPEGIEHVLVGGTFVVEAGEHRDDARPGAVLRARS
ncbi:MAG: dihydroorotase [Actinomycetota bacterium]|nr:MAG: dihydroorotase [Actinomycetota bacterium]